MILFRHIIKTHITPFFSALAILVFLFIMQYAIQILDKIITRGLDPGIVLEIFLINLGWIIALTIPMAILAATLMAFGTMSADNEILAIKASGLNLYYLITPVFSCAAVLCVILIFFNNLILPEANHRTANLMSDIGRKRPAALIEPGVLIKDFENYSLYVGKSDGRTGRLQDIKIFSDVPGQDPSTTVADSGYIRMVPGEEYLQLTLYHGESHRINRDNTRQHVVAQFNTQRILIPNVDTELHRTDRTYRSDREKSSAMMAQDIRGFNKEKKALLHEHAQNLDSLITRIRMLDEEETPDSAELSPDSSTAASQGFEAWFSATVISSPRIQKDYQNRINEQDRLVRKIELEETKKSRYLVEIHKKYAIPIACLVFVLIGAPLGIMARRGGLTVGASYSLFFFILYWAFLMKGENLADNRVIPPWIAMWSANILIGSCGIILLIRMVRETTFLSFGAVTRGVRIVWDIIHKNRLFSLAVFCISLPLRIVLLPLYIVRHWIGRVSTYCVRMFSGYLVGLIGAICIVFCVVDYISNPRRFPETPPRDVVLFYWYYLPWVIQLVLPVVTLLASMFTIGQMAKYNELTAVKASGMSFRRLVFPLLFGGILLSGLSFYIGESILPEANVKRREHLEVIKASKRSGYRPGREFRRNFFYFGNDSSIYCFQEFRTMPQRAKNVWRETFSQNRVVERIQAQREVYSDSGWYFVDGHVRVFQEDTSRFLQFDTLRDTVLSATPEEMVVKIKSPEEMSYWELKRYIEKSKRRGENVQQFASELHFKIAFPFMSFIVMLIGLGISARTGRGGGAILFGIGILLTFSYWFIARFALTLGKNGNIPPLAGAWIGNILYFLLGTYLYGKSSR